MIEWVPNYKKISGVYRAPCPVHQGKDRNLKVTQAQDGTWLAYCFVCGCNQNDVAKVLGIPFEDIYPDYEKKDTSKPRYPKGCDMELDRNLIEIHEANPTDLYSDYKAYKQAKARFTNFNEKMKEWMAP